jgi:CRP-like cAMP-binding protein
MPSTSILKLFTITSSFRRLQLNASLHGDASRRVISHRRPSGRQQRAIKGHRSKHVRHDDVQLFQHNTRGGLKASSHIERFIHKLGRRDDLPEAERNALRGLDVRVRDIESGRDIIAYGSRVNVSSLLLTGLSGRYSALAGGRRQFTEVSLPGDFIDLHGFVMKQLDHGVQAFSACRILEAPHEQLKTLTERQPHLMRLLWLETVIDAAVHRQWLLAMGRQNGPARLARLVCELYVRLEAVELAYDHRMDLALTQQDVGDILGFSAVHTNRTLQVLRERGLLTWRDQQVDILDWRGLVDLADFDPTYLRLRKEPV